MKKSIYKQKKIWFLVLVFLALWSYSILSFFSFRDSNFVGPISSITKQSIIIDDGRVGNTEIFYSSRTPILAESGAITTLQIGNPVFIATQKDANGEFEAKFIRILEAKHFRKKIQ